MPSPSNGLQPGGSNPPRVVAAAIGLCTGLATSSMIADGNAVALVAGVLFAAAALLLTRAVTIPAARINVILLVALAITLRYAAAALLRDGLIAMGRDGFITGDDRTYAGLSWRLVQLFRGEFAEFSYGAESYLLGTYVYLESAVFAVVGPNVLVVELLNGAFAGVVVALVYDLTRRLFGTHRGAVTAAVVVAVYPSLVLWSALNLKDSLAHVLIATTLWLLAVFFERPRPWLVPAMYIPVVLMQDLREYIFIVLTLVIPAGVILSAHHRQPAGRTGAAVALALSGAFLFTYAAESRVLSASTLATLESVRAGMGLGARTRIVDVPVVRVQEGQTYVVPATVASSAASLSAASTVPPSSAPTVAPTPAPSVAATVAQARAATVVPTVAPTLAATVAPSPSPALTPTVAPTQRVVTVTPGAQIVVAATTAASATPRANVVVVSPGDLVVVGGPSVTLAPAEQRQALAVPSDSRAVELGSDAESALALRTLRYLPIGLAYALFAPFPWAIGRPLDVLPIPEMLLWYACLVAASVVLARRRQHWRALSPLVMFILGTVTLLALAEGNVGTLYRHRAMVIPFVVVVAAPALADLFDRAKAARFRPFHRGVRRVALETSAGD